mmetsp:Transcript_26447/g.47681  ORF Transcript_26447/g.47681 Transcript_26447/m.47681 type:complete len:168 (-) Transcript_26447:27-530(-)
MSDHGQTTVQYDGTGGCDHRKCRWRRGNTPQPQTHSTAHHHQEESGAAVTSVALEVVLAISSSPVPYTKIQSVTSTDMAAVVSDLIIGIISNVDVVGPLLAIFKLSSLWIRHDGLIGSLGHDQPCQLYADGKSSRYHEIFPISRNSCSATGAAFIDAAGAVAAGAAR